MHGYGGSDGRTHSHRAKTRGRTKVKVAGAAVLVLALMAGITLLVGGGLQNTMAIISLSDHQQALRVVPVPTDLVPGSSRAAGSELSTPGTTSTGPAPTTGSPRPASTQPSSTRQPWRASRSTTRSALPSSTTSTTSSASSTSTGTVGGALAQQVLDQLNQARAQAGLPALSMNAGLVRSAAKHNDVMAAGCGLSHQCPGEDSLGDRISAQGVDWNSAGENIGEGGPVQNTDAAILAMATRLTSSMLAETPPNDGHRQNILSTSFRYAGISLLRDANGVVWMTQDFSG